MNNLSRIAKLMRHFTVYIIIPLIISRRLLSWGKITVNTFYIAYHQLIESHGLLDHDIAELPVLGKLLFFLLESISSMCLLIALWYFIQILDLYKKNKFFTKDVVLLLQKINVVMLAWTIYELFFDTIASIVISLFKAPGNRYILASVSFNDIVHLFITIVIFMTLCLMKEAYQIKTDQDLVV